jgi:ATP-binding cassette subfamily B protein
MRGGGGRGHWGGSEPDLTARPGHAPRTLRQIAGFFGPYRGRLAVISGLILVTVSIGVVNPILLKLIIDNLLGRRTWACCTCRPG